LSSVTDVLHGLPSISAWQERVYKDLHAHPELSFHETRTAALAAAKLKELGYEVLEQIGRTGVVGVFRNGMGQTVLARADMDASRQGAHMIAAFAGFTLFGIGLGLYATPSTDAALSNVPADKAGAASGIYKMASSLGAALGVAVSAAIFTALSGLEGELIPLSDVFLGRTDNIDIRFAGAVALLFNVLMVAVAMVAIGRTVPRHDPGVGR
jgi:hypothetical protein